MEQKSFLRTKESLGRLPGPDGKNFAGFPKVVTPRIGKTSAPRVHGRRNAPLPNPAGVIKRSPSGMTPKPLRGG